MSGKSAFPSFRARVLARTQRAEYTKKQVKKLRTPGRASRMRFWRTDNDAQNPASRPITNPKPPERYPKLFRRGVAVRNPNRHTGESRYPISLPTSIRKSGEDFLDSGLRPEQRAESGGGPTSLNSYRYPDENNNPNNSQTRFNPHRTPPDGVIEINPNLAETRRLPAYWE